MKRILFIVAMCLCSVSMGQTLLPTPDPISTPQIGMTQQTLGEMLRLCVEIKADVDRADWAAGAAKKHLEECQRDYDAAWADWRAARIAWENSYYTNPIYLALMDLYSMKITVDTMRLNIATNAFNVALAELTKYQIEFSMKGC